MLDSQLVTHLHDRYNHAAHLRQAIAPPAEPLAALILLQHQANFDLWHEEDKARDPAASPSVIVQVKQAIDRFNQQRNDFVEQIDAILLTAASPQNESAPLHSETPGLIIDRLSILSLKLFHTAEESTRLSAAQSHRDRSLQRLEILTQQRADLAQCLGELWQQVLAGQRRFKLYRQMKMYNDPDFNPVLYGRISPRP